MLERPESSLFYQDQAIRLLQFMDQQRFRQSTQWLRPYTRWATRFSINTPHWVPALLRNAPLKLSSLVLRGYHRALR